MYVRDLQTGSATFVSRASGAAEPRVGFTPSMSADGRFVAFSSDADSISSEDNDLYRNVFVRELGARCPRADVHVGHGDRGRRQLGRAGRPGRHPRRDPALVVRSKRTANRRALVHFALPAVPAGCRSPTRSCG